VPLPKPKKQIPNNNICPEERRRLLNLIIYEEEARQSGFTVVAGVDEAGRGPLAGPVVAAACVIPYGVFFVGIDDSKKLDPIKRKRIFEQIVAEPGINYGVGMVSSNDIDKINILQATIQAMLQAVANLTFKPDLLLVDGLQLPHPVLSCRKIIKGDAKSQSIAAASIIAKETRDSLMREYHRQWPQYGFDQHKGYGTPQHFKTIAMYGPCPIHRLTFEPLKEMCAKKWNIQASGGIR
jgi:ribonuclease HII